MRAAKNDLTVPAALFRRHSAVIFAEKLDKALAPLCKGSSAEGGEGLSNPGSSGHFRSTHRASQSPRRGRPRHPPFTQGGQGIGGDRSLEGTAHLPPCSMGAAQQFLRKSRIVHWLPCVKGAPPKAVKDCQNQDFPGISGKRAAAGQSPRRGKPRHPPFTQGGQGRGGHRSLAEEIDAICSITEQRGSSRGQGPPSNEILAPGFIREPLV